MKKRTIKFLDMFLTANSKYWKKRCFFSALIIAILMLYTLYNNYYEQFGWLISIAILQIIMDIMFWIYKDVYFYCDDGSQV